MQKELYIGFVIICVLSSCVKAPECSNIPQIKFVSVSSSYVTTGHLDTIIFSFTDCDGDVAPNPSYPSIDNCITGGDSSVLYKNYDNIFLFQSNNFACAPTPFASPDLQPTSGSKVLSGQIKIYELVTSSKCFQCGNSGDTCFAGGNPQDTITYTIYLRDLAGHLSNAIQTPAITTGCQ